MKPRLSILICSIPSRWEMAKTLYDHILSMVGEKDIEVLLLMDNKKRTIGEKREAIKNISNGKYFMFVDDDDTLYSIDEVYEACFHVDVVTFKNKSLNADGSSFIVTFGLTHEVEHTNNGKGQYVDLKRPPFTQCAWSERFKHIEFPSSNYGEDWAWVEQALKIAKTETFIDKVIHGYNFDPNVSEAEFTVDPAYKKYLPDIPKSPKRCVVNLVTSNPSYIKGQERLKYCMQFQNVDLLTFVGESSVGSPLHSENPYAFKVYAIEKAREFGYSQILWADASVFPVKDIEPVFDWLTEKGIFMEEAGHYAGTWSPDYVLKYFGITREEAMKMPMLAAGYVGFDFRNPISQEVFAEWKEAMLNGMFKGGWDVSRHDMTCISIIANKRGLLPLYSKGGHFFAYIGPAYGEPKETVVFHLSGMPT